MGERRLQQEINAPLPLLDAHGQLVRPGWARQPYWNYERQAIRAPRWRIKEWDYYSLFGDDGRFALTLTLADLGYLGLAAVCYVDMESRFFHQVDALIPFPMGRLGLGPDSNSGRVQWANRDLALDFDYRPGARHLRFRASRLRNARGDQGLEGEVVLRQAADLQSMNIATAWQENPRAFYYNRKINHLPAEGHMQIDKTGYTWNPERDFGALDWGRGHWTYRNRWYWGSASGWHEGHRLGWNIGYGFTDRTPASENTLFWDGIAHKLAEVEFHYNPRNYLEPWRFSSSDGRFEMSFAPALDRKSHTHLGLIRSEQHQVFGHYSGRVVLDTGEVVQVARMAGFAEDVLNWW
ncbi:DUF2804 domain-containing protein [Curvibacter sp. APW13]|uniref:DUF2804 domain-containing protein n=1 Tax=Curvibacter sp. APW13 TaxID=3077236 RepID=UPI0028DF406E|nr:DUF2804 domain-containing protein [Curvibacter sp. APW13]MDT8990234.1 DUF2804 domain-containing protein [Curvibacter sp. APW13]